MQFGTKFSLVCRNVSEKRKVPHTSRWKRWLVWLKAWPLKSFQLLFFGKVFALQGVHGTQWFTGNILGLWRNAFGVFLIKNFYLESSRTIQSQTRHLTAVENHLDASRGLILFSLHVLHLLLCPLSHLHRLVGLHMLDLTSIGGSPMWHQSGARLTSLLVQRDFQMWLFLPRCPDHSGSILAVVYTFGLKSKNETNPPPQIIPLLTLRC